MSDELCVKRRWAFAVLSLVFLVAAPASARSNRRPAEPDAAAVREHRACMNAYFEAQQELQTGHLRQARERYLGCSDKACGNVVREECRAKYSQMGIDIPTVIPVVNGRGGAPLVDVEVTVDGEPLTTRLDGRALPVDPGLHLFTFSAGSEDVELKVMIVQGERNRALTVTLGKGAGAETAVPAPVVEAPLAGRKPAPLVRPRRAEADTALPTADDLEVPRPRPRREPPPSSSSAVPYVLLGGLGILGVGSYGALVTWARDDNNRLRECSPNCPQASVDHVRQMYLAADVALGVGLTALATTTVIYVLSRPTKKKDLRYSFDVRLTASGAIAGVGGVF